MKEEGTACGVDDLGRIVIPGEIRGTHEIR